MISSVQLKIAIREALIKGIRRTGERIFSTSQETSKCYVPRDTGTLAKSGYIKPLENGIEIGYAATYSAKVEQGNPRTPYSGDQTVHIKKYKRKAYVTKNGTHVPATLVPAHDVTYHNKRLIGFRPKITKFERGPMIFRVLEAEPEREGQHYLARACKTELPSLPKDLEFFLKQIRI